MQKVEKTMNKEERRNFSGVFPYYLERFIPHMHLSYQSLLVKHRNKDRLMFSTHHTWHCNIR